MDDIDDKKIGKNIKNLREMKGYTQTQFAEILGTNKYTISKIEKGNIRLSLEKAVAIAKLFNLTIDELLFGEISYVVKKIKSVGGLDTFDKILAIPNNPRPVCYDKYCDYKKKLYDERFKYGETDSKNIVNNIKESKEKLMSELKDDYNDRLDWVSLQFMICINIESLIIFKTQWLIAHQIKANGQNKEKTKKEIKTFKGFMDFISINQDVWGCSENESMMEEWEYIEEEINYTWKLLGFLASYNTALFCYYQAIMYMYNLVYEPFDTGRSNFTEYGIRLLFLAEDMGGIIYPYLIENFKDLVSSQNVEHD